MFPEGGLGAEGSSGSIVSSNVFEAMASSRDKECCSGCVQDVMGAVSVSRWDISPVCQADGTFVTESCNPSLNVLDGNLTMMDSEPTESTSLLNTSQNPATRPSVEDGVTLVESIGLSGLTPGALSLDNFPGAGAAHRAAYCMLVLLKCRLSLQRQLKTASRDVWTRHNDRVKVCLGIEDIDRQVDAVWKEFTADYRSSEEIEAALWTEFPLKHGGDGVRGALLTYPFLPPALTMPSSVVDMIVRAAAPASLLRNGLVELSLERTWNRRLKSNALDSAGIFGRMMNRYDSLGAPR